MFEAAPEPATPAPKAKLASQPTFLPGGGGPKAAPKPKGYPGAKPKGYPGKSK